MKKPNASVTTTIAVLSVLCFAQFCAIVWVALKGQSFSMPDLAYQDFLTVIFTGVTIILSMLAVMIGVLAFIGWQGFHSNVERLTQTLIRDGFKQNGDFRKIMRKELRKELGIQIKEGFDEGGELRQVLKEEVDSIATSGIRSIYEDEEQEENG